MTRNELADAIWDALPYSTIPDHTDLVAMMTIVDAYVLSERREAYSTGYDEGFAEGLENA